VRSAVAGQLPAISRAISRELVGGVLLDEALELLKDEEAQVGGWGWGWRLPACLRVVTNHG
jgi:hypothetical protein